MKQFSRAVSRQEMAVSAPTAYPATL